MNRMEEARVQFDKIPIPAELDSRIRAGIAQGKQNSRRRARRQMWGTAAACLLVAFAALNTSAPLAAAAADIPVVGGLFRLMTVRSYQTETPDQTVTVQQPGLEGGGALAERINQEIQQRVEEKTREGEQLIQEYKDAFFATGGTQAEWDEHDNRVTVTYEIKSQTETTVSFVLHSDVSFANAYQEDAYYNLNLADGTEETLEDFLGADWVQICNASIRKQMEEAPDSSVYFPAEAGGFTTVDEDTSFYCNEAGVPVVVFPPYTVAPGYLGTVEFPIEP